MPKKPRTVLNERKLREYSKEHVFYELSMLLNAAILLESESISDSYALVRALRNATVESFALHARNIIDFFYPTKIWEGDVLADDYFPGGARPKRFPALSNTLKRARIRAHKEVSHLTTGRHCADSPRKAWHYDRILCEVFRVVAYFAKTADSKKLHKSVKAFITDMPKLWADVERVAHLHTLLVCYQPRRTN